MPIFDHCMVQLGVAPSVEMSTSFLKTQRQLAFCIVSKRLDFMLYC